MSTVDREPIEMRYMFSDVKPDRVKDLMNTHVFKARIALADLIIELTAEKTSTMGVPRVYELLKTAYNPAMEALRNQLKQAGWHMSEIAAADMVAHKMIRLP